MRPWTIFSYSENLVVNRHSLVILPLITEVKTRGYTAARNFLKRGSEKIIDFDQRHMMSLDLNGFTKAYNTTVPACKNS